MENQRIVADTLSGKGESMREPLSCKLIRIVRKTRIRIAKWIIRKAVRKLDEWQYESFLAYSWGFDDTTDYHIIKEVSTNEYHQYGTRVEYFDK